MIADSEPLSKAKVLFSQYLERCESQLHLALPVMPDANPLYQAMRYTLFSPSKRLRPALVYATAQVFGLNLDQVDKAACAIECMHTFSLIHDDLPAMDNDDLRRGVPSSHCVFGEDIAILAGDALLSFSFELLSQQPIADHLLRKNFNLLAKCSGGMGMALGQAYDCIFTKKEVCKEDIIHLHYLKTGALFEASILMGAISANITDETTLKTLSKISYELGLIFQLKDDLLDLQGNTQTLGKPAQSDLKLNKPSFTVRYGIEKTQALIDHTYQEVLALFQTILADTTPLELLTLLLIFRDR
jgi:geranylgeranyl pyrophosphate synthase